jgi:rod shape-determining protein MreC
MADFLRRHSLLFTSLLLLVVSAQLMSASVANRNISQYGSRIIGEVVAPINKTYYEVFETVHYYWKRYFWLWDVEKERDELLTRVKELEQSNAVLKELTRENTELRRILKFSQSYQLEGVAARVISRSPSNWTRTISIDRGIAHGLRPGLAVVDGKAIVGQVISVFSNSAKVLLLNDTASAIDVLLQSSRAAGIVEGRLDKPLELRYVVKESKVNLGEKIIASGLDGVFPKGLLVGEVNSVSSGSSGLFQSITVSPAVSFEKLENVFVVFSDLNVNEARDPVEQQPSEASE